MLSLSPAFALKQKGEERGSDRKRSYMLDLMYNAWAINREGINGKGYLKAADTLSKDEYEALKLYFKPIATNPTQDFKTVQSIAQDETSVHALFDKFEAKAPLSAQDVERWKENLAKLHKRLLTAIEQRVGGDPNYSEFLSDERQRSLGNYQAAYVARTALAKQVTKLEEKNKESQEELWSQTQRDPHTEMLIRMRQGVEILYAIFLDFEQQRFQQPESKVGKTKVEKINSANATARDKDLHIRSGQAPFKDGPNPLLPPPWKRD